MKTQRFNNYKFRNGQYANKTIPEVYKINYQYILDLENTSKDTDLLKVLTEFKEYRNTVKAYKNAFKENEEFSKILKTTLKNNLTARSLSKKIKEIEDIDSKKYIKEALDTIVLDIQRNFYESNFNKQDKNNLEEFTKLIEENKDKLQNDYNNSLRDIISSFAE
ncbi:hypothetical protein [Aliarcobacter butzleri]|uniref:hypothetical protein n=1 Tax=Aliarcobacter butzleri TaxID=28197 RepID=UPI0021B3A12E|nr:hypothetical protein [Aliarcobacter butzleri]MCT7632124.1 hypothetical protein [Aliarcobacter butzleri]